MRFVLLILFFLSISFIVSGQVLAEAESRAEVLERIKPVGTVAVEGQAAPPAAAPAAAPAPAPAPMAEAKPEPKPAAEKAPAPVQTAAAVPAGGGADGAGLY